MRGQDDPPIRYDLDEVLKPAPRPAAPKAPQLASFEKEPKQVSWVWLWLAFMLALALLVAVLASNMGWFTVRPLPSAVADRPPSDTEQPAAPLPPRKPTPPAQVAPPDLVVPPLPATEANALGPAPAPPGAVAEAPAEPKPNIIGRAAALGKVTVEVEHYWVEDVAKDTVYAALAATMANGSTTAMAMPPLDVQLGDEAGRLYKPYKTKQSGYPTLNPSMKCRNVWAFQLPAHLPMTFVQFDTRGEQPLRIFLSMRTRENADLVASDDYAATLDELMAFASPRFAAQQQVDEATAKLGPIMADGEVLQKRLIKVEKRVKSATDAAESAKANLQRKLATVEDAKARLKDLASAPADSRHNERTQQIAIGRAEQALQKAEKDAADAAAALKDKAALRAKAEAELKDELHNVETLKAKFDAQQKAIETLQQKLPP
ncbi:MAG: hypothetical protein NTW87_20280 [Planctomycetota bacterium]|nr:hypothetical protein [Planctomycetota bacterium]